MKSVMRTSLVLLILGGFAKPASADWLLTPYLGNLFGGSSNTFNIDNPSDEFENRFSFGGSATWLYATGRVGLEADYHFAPNFYRIADGSDFDSSVQTLMLNAVVGPTLNTSGPRFRPYAAVGVGLMRSTVNSPDELFENLSNNELGLNIGGGLHSFLSDNFAIRADARYFLGFQKGDDGGQDLDYETDFNFWRATVGVTFRFGQ
jgi:opacity protein-like surface antigen